MVYRYSFDIHRPNPSIALGAARLGETMRSNRMLEAQRDAAARERQAAAEEQMRRYGVQESREAMSAVAELYNRTGGIEDPAARQAAFERGYDLLRRRYPARNGVDPFADFDRTWRQDEYDALRTVTGGDSTALMRELEAAGLEPGTPEYQSTMLAIKTRPLASTTVEAPKPAPNVSEFQKTLGKRLATSFADLQDAGTLASQTLDQLRRAEQLGDQINYTGAGAEALQGVKRWARAFGVDPQDIGLTDDTAPAEAMRALTTAFVTNELQKFKGATTDFEFQALERVLPGLSQTPDGRQMIVETMRKVAQKQVAQAEHMANWVASQDPATVSTAAYNREVNRFNRANPLFTDAEFDVLETGQAPTAAAPQAPADPTAVQGVMTQYGVDQDVATRIVRTAEQAGVSVDEAMQRARELGYFGQ